MFLNNIECLRKRFSMHRIVRLVLISPLILKSEWLRMGPSQSTITRYSSQWPPQFSRARTQYLYWLDVFRERRYMRIRRLFIASAPTRLAHTSTAVGWSRRSNC